MQTTVEHPGGVDLLRSDKGWDFTCVTLFTAPKTMTVGDTADVETDLLTTADRAKVDALMTAVQHAADASIKDMEPRRPGPSPGLTRMLLTRSAG